MSDEVLVAVADNIMTVTINRPLTKNSVNMVVAQGIAEAMDMLDSRPEIRVGILTGAGGSFCAGMDLKAFVAGEKPIVEGRGFAGLCEKPPQKPLIAAVEGYALAGGCELAMSCDLIVAADNSQFGIPEAKLGLSAAAGGLMRFPRQIPYRLAMEYALTGDLFSAKRAYELGFINRLVEPGTALLEAEKLAKKIASNGPLAVVASKQVIAQSSDWKAEEMFQKQAGFIDPVFDSEDAIEGATAFAEKRPPIWKGK